jgi:predicted DNA-binding transcriptional regulator AlpA
MNDASPLRLLNRQARRRRRRLVPFVVDARRLARLLCCGLRTIRAYDAAGKLPEPIKLAGRVLWRVDEICAWLRAGAPDRSTWTAMRATREKLKGK